MFKSADQQTHVQDADSFEDAIPDQLIPSVEYIVLFVPSFDTATNRPVPPAVGDQQTPYQEFASFELA